MNLIFNKVILHNFLSYAHAEVDLRNKGFCFVSGENHCRQDNSLSNGSGKSTIWSAITYALFNETIQGQSSDLKNINIDEPDCWVELSFTFNTDEFVITRYHKPKSDLRIIKNKEDISGKGITESKAILAKELPELTKDLVASIIIIGQGMPNKFSSFVPSGRKDLLEKLTKSDFMIEDIKERLVKRQQEISAQLRSVEDKLLVNNTQQASINNNLNTAKLELSSKVKPDYDTLIKEAQATIDLSRLGLNDAELQLKMLENSTEEANKVLIACGQTKAQAITESYDIYNQENDKLLLEKKSLEQYIKVHYEDKIQENKNKISVLSLESKNLKAEIERILSTPNTCPYCKQKLPHAHKVDTTPQTLRMAEISDLILSLNEESNIILDASKVEKEKVIVITEKVTKLTAENQARLQKINENYSASVKDANAIISDNQLSSMSISTKASILKADITKAEGQITKYNWEQSSWDKQYADLQKRIVDLTAQFENLITESKGLESNKLILVERVATLKKIETLIKRDFRGYLLSNIIQYISKKAKEYSKLVFGTDKLDFYLDGNNIEISYCNKPFAGLSGGEKTRVDLILQLALRNMLQAYLNFSTNVIVLDEVTDFLDKKSCDSIMSLLDHELNTVESVFIISHHIAELDLPVDSELKIIKNENGISEVIG